MRNADLENEIIIALMSALSSSGIMGLITFLIQRQDSKRKEKQIEDSAQSKLLLGLAHDRIMTVTDFYVRRNGITLKEKRNLEYLYNPYREAGGNGDCKIGYEACQSLSIISDDDAEKLDKR